MTYPKMILTSAVFASSILFMSCGGSGGGSASSVAAALTNAPPASGIRPVNGNYLALGVSCIDQTGNVIAAYGFDAASPASSVALNGNSYTNKEITAACTVTETGSLTYHAQTQVGSEAYGDVTITPQTETITGTSPCTHTTTLVPMTAGAPAVSPNPDVTHYTGTPSAPGTATLIYDPTTLLLYANIAIPSRPDGSCFLVYSKQ